MLFFIFGKIEFLKLKKKDINRLNALLDLIYYPSDKSINLTILRQRSSFTLPKNFSGKKIVLWLTENFNSNITKVRISNYSAILSLPIVSYTREQKFSFKTYDGVLCKIMFSQNFYDDDSEQYHKVMLQEKLNGSYVI